MGVASLTDYVKQFDAKIGSLETAVNAVIAQVERQLPGFNRRAASRLFASLRASLFRVDKGKVKHPEFLAHSNGSVPQHVITSLDDALNYANQGGAAFAQHALPNLVFLQERLERASGVEARELEEFQVAAVADIRAMVSESEEMTARLLEAGQKAESARAKSESDASKLDTYLSEATSALAEVSEIRRKVDNLASGDGRTGKSIEKQLQIATEKAQKVKEVHDDIVKILEQTQEAKERVDTNLGRSNIEYEKIKSIRSESESVLKLATQAGLAASYRSERETVKKQQNIYTGVFYSAILIILCVAIFYVLPAFEGFIIAEGAIEPIQAAFIAFTRVAVLAPLIWAVHFTSQRIQKLEILQVDYAEKAAASLAYSGYRSEMEADPDLLLRLKDGLLTRFSEHPERLLRTSSSSLHPKVASPAASMEAGEQGV